MILALLLKRMVKKIMLKKLRSALGSTTIGVAGATVLTGLLVQYSDQVGTILVSLVPMQYGGLVLSLLGVVVAIARLRTLGGTEPSAEDPKQ